MKTLNWIWGALTAITFLALTFLSYPAFAEGLKVGEVPFRETFRLENRVVSKDFWSVGFGPYLGANSQQVLYGYHIARHWEASSRGEIRLGLSGAANGEAALTTLTLGGAFFFSRSNVSPYIGVDAGYGFSAGPELDTAAGFAGKAAFGVRLFRIASTQLDIAATYSGVFGSPNPGVTGIQLSVLY